MFCMRRRVAPLSPMLSRWANDWRWMGIRLHWWCWISIHFDKQPTQEHWFSSSHQPSVKAMPPKVERRWRSGWKMKWGKWTRTTITRTQFWTDLWMATVSYTSRRRAHWDGVPMRFVQLAHRHIHSSVGSANWSIRLFALWAPINWFLWPRVMLWISSTNLLTNGKKQQWWHWRRCIHMWHPLQKYRHFFHLMHGQNFFDYRRTLKNRFSWINRCNPRLSRCDTFRKATRSHRPRWLDPSPKKTLIKLLCCKTSNWLVMRMRRIHRRQVFQIGQKVLHLAVRLRRKDWRFQRCSRMWIMMNIDPFAESSSRLQVCRSIPAITCAFCQKIPWLTSMLSLSLVDGNFEISCWTSHVH